MKLTDMQPTEHAMAVERMREVLAGRVAITPPNDPGEACLAWVLQPLPADAQRLRAQLAHYEERYPCDGLCDGQGPMEDCSRHGRTPAELWALMSELQQMFEAARAQVAAALAEANRWDHEAEAQAQWRGRSYASRLRQVMLVGADESSGATPTEPTPTDEPDPCTCPYTDPSTWLSAASCGYGSGYEPGSMQEWNPDCPVHPPSVVSPSWRRSALAVGDGAPAEPTPRDVRARIDALLACQSRMLDQWSEVPVEERTAALWTPLHRAADHLREVLAFWDDGLLAAPPSTGAADETLREALGRAWDDGNAMGLDGYIGPNRGAGEVDPEAVRARDAAIARGVSPSVDPATEAGA